MGGDGEEAAKQGQMRDQGEFREDPRGEQEVAEQQPETQPGGDGGEGNRPSSHEDEAQGETGRDDGGEVTGNPANAG